MMVWSDTEALDSSRGNINGGLRGARNATMLQVLGGPRGSYSEECQDPTNPGLIPLIVREDVGPFEARGLRPAVAALRRILDDVKADEPDLHRRLGNAGMLCCRFVRDSKSVISNHSWGVAIDLTIDGILDKRGDNRAQRGLLRVREHFNRYKFFWGAAFRTEDSMHFEASDDLILEWQADGSLGDAPRPRASSLLEFGDRGAEVAALQQMLSERLGIRLVLDGMFGPATRAAVIAFQARRGLEPDGKVGPKTLAALRAPERALV